MEKLENIMNSMCSSLSFSMYQLMATCKTAVFLSTPFPLSFGK